METRELTLHALQGIPDVCPGDDLTAILLHALRDSEVHLRNGDVLVITHKIVSKAEGCLVDLSTVEPSPSALTLAQEVDKDPRLVEVILRQSRAVVRRRPGTLIMETHHGWICANAGVDRSNVAGEGAEIVLTLPQDPDASARQIREGLAVATGADVAVIISDTHGRAWRLGTVNVAIG
ncbi:MAG: coenzyme F420-0:L-glutamate ligase, partial [Anaerolineae bacterium]|nr:coenzyme F420-0:L-glutamate ligase [Anaerolineae bacterium]